MSGRKGQQWGVRNGPPYPLNAKGLAKFRKNYEKQYSISTDRNAKDVNSIYRSLSDDDKRKVSGGEVEKRFTTQDEYSKTLGSFMLKHKNTPISAFDIWSEADDKGNYANEAAVSVLTRSGDQYRGKGYASKVVDRGMKWLDENPDITHVYWDVRRDNAASIALAKKHGFKEMKGTTHPEWTAYHKVYKNKRKKSK